MQPGSAAGDLGGELPIDLVQVGQERALTIPVKCETIDYLRGIHGRRGIPSADSVEAA
jgi:hypothetical protein